jgi:transporter family-2 protein
VNLSFVLLGSLAFFVGSLFPVQIAINAMLARAIGGPVFASAISFAVGDALLAALAIWTSATSFSSEFFRSTPFFVLVGGGVLGAIYVTSNIFLVPRLGSAAALGFGIAGQLLAAALLDHFGILGLAEREVSAGRLVGAVLILVGALLIRVF